MIQLPEEFDSIFRYIVVVSHRTEQLMGGARPRMEPEHAKPTLQAKDDVDAGLVDWRVLTQEELDAQRQAMVEQFRAEMTPEEAAAAEEGSGVRDVLPTSSEGEPARPVMVEDGEEETDRDDELLRLQRMLGIAGVSADDDAESDADADADDEAEGDEDQSMVDLDDDAEDDED
jgi:DNA-directed RNA polymerase subunit K/omega